MDKINTSEHSRKLNTGGPAFPHPAYANTRGMSLRDYFAGMALQALAQNPHVIEDFDFTDRRAVALRAYQMADAMLVARGVA